MFERFTEKARRVIFFARYEASQFGSPYIESEHLLLGVVREDKALTNRFLRSEVASIRKHPFSINLSSLTTVLSSSGIIRPRSSLIVSRHRFMKVMRFAKLR